MERNSPTTTVVSQCSSAGVRDQPGSAASICNRPSTYPTCRPPPPQHHQDSPTWYTDPPSGHERMKKAASLSAPAQQNPNAASIALLEETVSLPPLSQAAYQHQLHSDKPVCSRQQIKISVAKCCKQRSSGRLQEIESTSTSILTEAQASATSDERNDERRSATVQASHQTRSSALTKSYCSLPKVTLAPPAVSRKLSQSPDVTVVNTTGIKVSPMVRSQENYGFAEPEGKGKYPIFVLSSQDLSTNYGTGAATDEATDSQLLALTSSSDTGMSHRANANILKPKSSLIGRLSTRVGHVARKLLHSSVLGLLPLLATRENQDRKTDPVLPRPKEMATLPSKFDDTLTKEVDFRYPWLVRARHTEGKAVNITAGKEERCLRRTGCSPNQQIQKTTVRSESDPVAHGDVGLQAEAGEASRALKSPMLDPSETCVSLVQGQGDRQRHSRCTHLYLQGAIPKTHTGHFELVVMTAAGESHKRHRKSKSRKSHKRSHGSKNKSERKSPNSSNGRKHGSSHGEGTHKSHKRSRSSKRKREKGGKRKKKAAEEQNHAAAGLTFESSGEPFRSFDFGISSIPVTRGTLPRPELTQTSEPGIISSTWLAEPVDRASVEVEPPTLKSALRNTSASSRTDRKREKAAVPDISPSRKPPLQRQTEPSPGTPPSPQGAPNVKETDKGSALSLSGEPEVDGRTKSRTKSRKKRKHRSKSKSKSERSSKRHRSKGKRLHKDSSKKTSGEGIKHKDDREKLSPGEGSRSPSPSEKGGEGIIHKAKKVRKHKSNSKSKSKRRSERYESEENFHRESSKKLGEGKGHRRHGKHRKHGVDRKGKQKKKYTPEGSPESQPGKGYFFQWGTSSIPSVAGVHRELKWSTLQMQSEASEFSTEFAIRQEKISTESTRTLPFSSFSTSAKERDDRGSSSGRYIAASQPVAASSERSAESSGRERKDKKHSRSRSHGHRKEHRRHRGHTKSRGRGEHHRSHKSPKEPRSPPSLTSPLSPASPSGRESSFSPTGSLSPESSIQKSEHHRRDRKHKGRGRSRHKRRSKRSRSRHKRSKRSRSEGEKTRSLKSPSTSSLSRTPEKSESARSESSSSKRRETRRSRSPSRRSRRDKSKGRSRRRRTRSTSSRSPSRRRSHKHRSRSPEKSTKRARKSRSSRRDSPERSPDESRESRIVEVMSRSKTRAKSRRGIKSHRSRHKRSEESGTSAKRKHRGRGKHHRHSSREKSRHRKGRRTGSRSRERHTHSSRSPGGKRYRKKRERRVIESYTEPSSTAFFWYCLLSGACTVLTGIVCAMTLYYVIIIKPNPITSSETETEPSNVPTIRSTTIRTKTIRTDYTTFSETLTASEHTWKPPVVFPTSRPARVYYCTTEHCRREALYVGNLLSHESPPCDNFYKHVCDVWTNEHPAHPFSTGSLISQNTLLQDSLARQLLDVLSNATQADVLVAAKLYNRCTDRGRTTTGSKEAVNALFSQWKIEKWPRTDPAQDVSVWLFAAELSRDLDLETLIQHSIGIDPNNKADRVVELGQPRCLCSSINQESEEARELMKTAVRESIAYLGVSSVDGLEDRLLAACVSIAAICRTRYPDESVIVVRVGELTFGLRAFLAVLHNGRIQEHDHVVLRSAPHLPREIENALQSVPPLDVLNYFGFLAIVRMAPFLPDNLRNVRDVFAASLLGHRVGNPENNRLLCLRLVESVLPDCFSKAAQMLRKSTGLEVSMREWLSQLEAVFLRHLADFPWIDELSSLFLRYRVKRRALIRFGPSANDQQACAPTGPLDVEDALLLFANVSQLQHERMLHRLYGDGTLLGIHTTGSEFSTQPSFQRSLQTFHVPAAMMNASVPSNSSSFVFHLARVAVRFYRALVQLLHEDPYERDPSLSFTHESRGKLSALLSCFDEDAKSSLASIDASPTEESVANLRRAFLDRTSALLLATKAFDELFPLRRIWNYDLRLAGLEELTAKQLFFIYFALDNCESADPAFHKPSIPPEYKVNVPLRHNKEFAHAFGCNAQDLMVADESGPCTLMRRSRQRRTGTAKQNGLARGRVNIRSQALQYTRDHRQSNRASHLRAPDISL